MIHYSPVDGDVRRDPIAWRPKTAFIMQQLGSPIPPKVKAVRKQIESALAKVGFAAVDATSVTTGRDYLLKIWNLLLGCPVGLNDRAREILSAGGVGDRAKSSVERLMLAF